ncbi:hypothetical protein CR51_35925 [Caballeronia megalochromosomata]|nr:hypothetical protein CR51_35925 [Caballeronia megalochromosomata]
MNQHGGPKASVRFGTLGKGYRPNYQIESASGVFAYLGNGHSLASNSKQYAEGNLTRPYSYDEVANRFETALPAAIAEYDFAGVFAELRASIAPDVLAMLEAHAGYPAGRAPLDALARSVDEMREDELAAAYLAFADDVALGLGLPNTTGMTVLAAWERATRDWVLKPEVLRALQETILDDPQTKAAPETERRELRNARIGQGNYRARMLELWGGRCSVTGCAVKSVLVASHAKAWAESSNEERLDRYNGLLLSGTLDRLFDVGLIGFTDDGKILTSDQLSEEDKSALGISDETRLRQVFEPNKKYLKAHREKYGLIESAAATAG